MVSRFALIPAVMVACASIAPIRAEQPEQPEWPKLLHSLHGFSYGLAFSPDSKTLAAGGREGGIRSDRAIVLWDVARGKARDTFKGQQNLWALAFSPDGKLLASGGDDIKLWDVTAGKVVSDTKGHRRQVKALAFSPGGKLLATGGDSNPNRTVRTVGLWEVETLDSAAAVPRCTDQVKTVAFSPDGKTLAFAGMGGAIHLWDVGAGRERVIIEPGGAPWIQSVAFSPDGKTLAVALQYRGAKKGAAPLDGPANAPVGQPVSDRNVTLWDTTTGKLVGQLEGHERMLTSVAFSPDGKLLASASSEHQTVRLWDVESKKTVATLEVKSQEVIQPQADWLAFSPDGKVLAVASWRGDVINLWSLERGK